jgi:hypothetical protein
MEPGGRWRELLDQRLAEAVADLGAVPGVRGLIVCGSIGRGRPRPLSDIDLVPIYAGGPGRPRPAHGRGGPTRCRAGPDLLGPDRGT